MPPHMNTKRLEIDEIRLMDIEYVEDITNIANDI